jgi:hypothetical protein
MMRYRDSRLFVWGMGLLVLGSGPLLAIIAAASMGLTKDPNPNPIGPGLLAALTFWPSIIMIVVGAIKVSRARKS